MMYNLTYLGHRVTLPWLDLRSNFDLDLSRSNYTWFDAPWRDKHDGIKIVALPLKLKIVSSKNRFGKFWIFDPWWRQFWPEPKNDRNDFEMIFRELSNAVFRFVLRCAGAEIDGGVFKHPPPAGRGKSRGPAGRGLRRVEPYIKWLSKVKVKVWPQVESGQGHVMIEMGHIAYHSIRLAKTNVLTPIPRLYLFLIKSYWQMTVGDLGWPQMTFGGAGKAIFYSKCPQLSYTIWFHSKTLAPK